MPSFRGHTFKEQGSDTTLPSRTPVGHYVISAAGVRTWQGPSTPASIDDLESVAAQGTAAEYQALLGDVGLTGTLAGYGIVEPTDYPNMRLLGISGAVTTHPSLIVRFTLKFGAE